MDKQKEREGETSLLYNRGKKRTHTLHFTLRLEKKNTRSLVSHFSFSPRARAKDAMLRPSPVKSQLFLAVVLSWTLLGALVAFDTLYTEHSFLSLSSRRRRPLRGGYCYNTRRRKKERRQR